MKPVKLTIKSISIICYTIITKINIFINDEKKYVCSKLFGINRF
jgi:hypothetical protein